MSDVHYLLDDFDARFYFPIQSHSGAVFLDSKLDALTDALKNAKQKVMKDPRWKMDVRILLEAKQNSRGSRPVMHDQVINHVWMGHGDIKGYQYSVGIKAHDEDNQRWLYEAVIAFLDMVPYQPVVASREFTEEGLVYIIETHTVPKAEDLRAG